MVYYTGDIHGEILRVVHFIHKHHLKDTDTIVILGDVGLNFYLTNMDRTAKKKLNKFNVNILCIHGNHEARPQTIDTYTTKEWQGGTVYYEKEFPYLLFAKDGEVYDLDGKQSIAIGGAYSIDKDWRLNNGIPWFSDEQPSDEIKKTVINKLDSLNWNIDQVLSHTCPYKYRPVDTFKAQIPQDQIDTSTEEWLDSIEDKLEYNRWLCGHWHINRRIDKMQFLMQDFVD